MRLFPLKNFVETLSCVWEIRASLVCLRSAEPSKDMMNLNSLSLSPEHLRYVSSCFKSEDGNHNYRE